MEGRIYDILTDLLRDDITKDKAIEELLVLCDVGKSNELLSQYNGYLNMQYQSSGYDDSDIRDFFKGFNGMVNI